MFDQGNLVSDTPQCQKYITTYMSRQKLPLYVNEYIFFKLTEELPGPPQNSLLVLLFISDHFKISMWS